MKPTAKTLAESVESIRDLGPRLNAITERAAQVVRLVENFLERESIGLPVLVDGSPVGDRRLYLAYRRHGSHFRVVIVTRDAEGLETSAQPWSDSTRGDKLATFHLLPALVCLVEEAVAGLLDSSGHTVRTVAETLSIPKEGGGL